MIPDLAVLLECSDEGYIPGDLVTLHVTVVPTEGTGSAAEGAVLVLVAPEICQESRLTDTDSVEVS